MREWFRIQLKANEAQEENALAEVFIYGDIGKSYWDDDAVGAKQFVDQVRALPASVKALRVRINSLGGHVFDATTIANFLRSQQVEGGRTVETVVDGIAASAASVVAMAGSPLRIADNALMMVHEPWNIGIGNAKAFRKMADDLDTIRGAIVATYKWKSKLSDAEIVALLEAETWMDADEAVEKGFADEKIEASTAVASLDPRGAAQLSVPDKFKARVEGLLKKPEPAPAPPAKATMADVVAACGGAGLDDLAFVRALAGENLTAEALAARVAAEKQKRTAAAARVADIRALCTKTNQPDLADEIVATGATVDQARALLTKVTAKLDGVEIDGHIKPDHGTKPKAVLNVNRIYAELNGVSAKKE